jgi:hypothetical protein
LGQEKNLNECPICHGKTEFIPIGLKRLKGKTAEIFGRYKCVKCDWHSDIQEPFRNLAKTARPKNAVYMYHTYDKEHKTLTFFVYTNEMKVEYPRLVGEKFDPHLLTVAVTPHSIRIWPKARLSIQENEVGKELMLLDHERELAANLCSNRSPERIQPEDYNSGVREIKELIEKIQNGQINDTRVADSIARAEEWQKDGYQAECVCDGKILMKKELEKILFGKKLQYDKEFRKKVLEDHCYSDADLYKTPQEDDS